MEVGKPFEMEDGWFCDVEQQGRTLHTAGPQASAADAASVARDWANRICQECGGNGRRFGGQGKGRCLTCHESQS